MEAAAGAMLMKVLSAFVTGLVVALILAGGQCFAQRAGGHAGAVGDARPELGLGTPPTADIGADPTGSSTGTEPTRVTPKSTSELLAQNTKVEEKVRSLLPLGTDLQAAAAGFRNLGQFVAAAHVSYNLGIPFDELKAALMGPPPLALGQAIRTLRPEVKSRMEAKRAQRKARREIRQSVSSS